MGLVVEIKNIVSPNNFKLFYQEGRTPGSVSEQASPTWGTQHGSIFPSSTTNITINFDIFEYEDTQIWFKILDVVTNSYTIENIYIHSIDFYTKCFTPTPTITPTFTPTLTPTYTPTITPTYTITPTITPTFTPTLTPTLTPTITPTYTPNPGETPTPTVTPEITYTYLAACSGGTILGWIEGNYAGSLGVTIDGSCYVTAYPTTNPTQGSLISGTQTWGTCCPTPTPTPEPGIAFGVYTGATFGTSNGACNDNNYPSISIFLNSDATPNVGDIFFNTISCIPGDEFVGNSNWYNVRKDSNKWAIQIGGLGTILNIVDCNSVTPTPTPTMTMTPPPNYYVIPVLYSGSTGTDVDSGSACWQININGQGSNVQDVYTITGYLVDGEYAYQDALGPAGAGVFNGLMHYYSDGINYGRIGYTGLITIVTSCAV